uniref:Acyl-CoA thioesterase n=2 Tax=Natrinema halophilum TaxID=1699371 RepID=A0A7D5KG09_9EURY
MDSTDLVEKSEFQTVYENRARFAETDPQGIVFYGEYFTFQDEAVMAFMREMDYSYNHMLENGWQNHVVNSELNYCAGAEFGDVICNDVRVTEFGFASFTVEYRARRASDDEVLAEGTVTHVAVDLETGDPTRIPDAFRDAVVTFQSSLESTE